MSLFVIPFIFLLLPVAAVTARTTPSEDFSVYIFADMEGCSGLTNRDQILTEEGSLRMAEDMNACIAACFAILSEPCFDRPFGSKSDRCWFG